MGAAHIALRAWATHPRRAMVAAVGNGLTGGCEGVKL